MKAAAATPSGGSTCRRRRRFLTGYRESEVSIKQEPEDDIKDYAETTMNELLGWYGYEKVDSRDTQGLNLQHFASANATSSPASTPEAGSGSEDPAHGGGGGSRPPSGRAASASPTQEGSSLTSDAVARQHQQMIAALPTIPKHPGASESPNLPPGCIVCAWCQKVGMKLFTLKTPTGCKAFCSEICFTQCRRASFKKNKVCDWCKHVRHTVNYVDFQDGEQQLQFCSDKCLNQYKMNIFCKETQAHLQMHTHLKEAACKMATGSGPVNLITPDLWLRDCKPQSNGNSQSSNEDAMEESPNSTESHTATGTTSLAAVPAPEHTRVSVSPVAEKKDTKLSCNGTPKERDKIHRRAGRPSSRHSSAKKTEKEDRTHHHNRHRDRAKVDIAKTNPSTPQFSPSPCSRKSSLANGPAPNLSSPPIRTSPRPNHHIHQKQVHHNTHLHSPPGIGMDHTRPPFFPPNLFPSPFHLVAQQQMEAFLRAQQGMGMRPTAPPPPPPPIPFPPWVVPPFPHAHAPPHHPPPPPPPPPPTLAAQTSSSSLTPAPINYSQPSPKHSSQSTANLSNCPNPTTTQSTTAASLLPPVTVMVPFPVVLPLPVPIPVPIPIPSHLIEKFTKQKEVQKEETAGEINQSKNTDAEEDVIERISDSDEMVSPVVSSSSDNTNSRPVDAIVNKIPQQKSWSSVRGEENCNVCPSLQMDNTCQTALKFQEVDYRLTDADSRSYSPLSEIITTDDDVIAGEDVLDSDVEPQPSRIFFTSYVDASQRSSLTASSTAAENHASGDLLGDSRSPSPSQNLLAEKRGVTDLSSSSINAKRKCIRDRANVPV